MTHLPAGRRWVCLSFARRRPVWVGQKDRCHMSDTPTPAGAANPYTLGELVADLERAESVWCPQNRAELERIMREEGSISAYSFALQVAALGARPHLPENPGGDRIELICDELSDGAGVSAASVR